MGRRTLIGGLLAAPMLAACDGDGPSGDGAPGGEGRGTSDGGASDGGTAAQAPPKPSVAVFAGPVEVDVAVVSVVRSGEHLVLTLELSAEDPESQLEYGPVYALDQLVANDQIGARAFDGIRLLDLAGDRVAVVGADAGGRTVRTEPAASWGERSGAGGSERVQLVYGDLAIDEVAVLIPKGGLLESIPVDTGEIPDSGSEEPLDLTEIAAAPVHELISVSQDLTTTTRTESTRESTTVSLGADVLFDSSSAELQDGAQTVIEEAARSLARHEPGPVHVVGHTDDVDDEAFNQTLSEQRAQAVADLLGTLIDGAEYPLEVSGKGESAPIADNTTQEGRALNRRVELSIDTPVVEETTVELELPTFDGPVASGEEGVELDSGNDIRYRVRCPGARVVQGHLVVAHEITRLGEAVDSVFGVGDSSTAPGGSLPLDIELTHTEGGIAVMDGPVATLPAWHRTGDDESPIRPLADLRTNGRIDGGVTRVSDIVYPVGPEIGDTVTLQLGAHGWRLTDVPVAR